MRALPLVFLSFLGFLSCMPRGASPIDDPEVLRETPWPACISRSMHEAMAYCPEVRSARDVSLTASVSCNEPQTPDYPPKEPVRPALDDGPVVAAEWPPALLRADEQAGFERNSGAAPIWAPTLPTDRQSEADVKQAQRSYEQQLRLKTHPLWGYVSFRLGTLERSLGDRSAALESLAAATRWASENRWDALHKNALLSLLDLYAAIGNTAEARVFFRAVSSAELAPQAATQRALERLAAAMHRRGQVPRALLVLEDLRDSNLVGVCQRQADVVIASQTLSDPAPAAVQAYKLLSEYNRLDVGRETEEIAQCAAVTSNLLLSLADQWHKEGLAADDHNKLGLAASLYGAFLANFQQKQLNDRGICVARADVAYKRAEALFRRHEWRDCAAAYEVAIAADSAGDRGEGAAFKSVLCNHQEWQRKAEARGGMNEQEKILSTLSHEKDWRRLLRSYHRYLCISGYHTPSPASYLSTALARADTFQQGGAVWEAVIAYRSLAFEYTDSVAGVMATGKYVELMDRLAVDDVCRIALGGDVAKLRSEYCAPSELKKETKDSQRSEVCTSMYELSSRAAELSGPQL